MAWASCVTPMCLASNLLLTGACYHASRMPYHERRWELWLERYGHLHLIWGISHANSIQLWHLVISRPFSPSETPSGSRRRFGEWSLLLRFWNGLACRIPSTRSLSMPQKMSSTEPRLLSKMALKTSLSLSRLLMRVTALMLSLLTSE